MKRMRILHEHRIRLFSIDKWTKLSIFLRNKQHLCAPFINIWFANSSFQLFFNLSLLKFPCFPDRPTWRWLGRFGSGYRLYFHLGNVDLFYFPDHIFACFWSMLLMSPSQSDGTLCGISAPVTGFSSFLICCSLMSVRYLLFLWMARTSALCLLNFVSLSSGIRLNISACDMWDSKRFSVRVKALDTTSWGNISTKC